MANDATAEIKVRPTPIEKAQIEEAAAIARQSINQWMIVAAMEKIANDKKRSRPGAGLVAVRKRSR